MRNLIFIVIAFLVISCGSQTKTTEQKTDSVSNISKSAPKFDKFVTPVKVTFNSLDDIQITGNLYQKDEKNQVVLLCHQADYNKSEYNEIASILYEKGYTCLAIDQRSGGDGKTSVNETAKLAVAKNKPITYLDAEQDIIAAINYLAKKYNQKIILFGSSYSASLALKIGKENENVKVVIAYSPGEYFDKKLILANAIKGLNKPVFATSAKSEAPEVEKLMKEITSTVKIHFIPKEEGVHGASALHVANTNHKEYWDALFEFFNKVK